MVYFRTHLLPPLLAFVKHLTFLPVIASTGSTHRAPTRIHRDHYPIHCQQLPDGLRGAPERSPDSGGELTGDFKGQSRGCDVVDRHLFFPTSRSTSSVRIALPETL